MATRIVNFFKLIRNNWKKSLFGASVLTYGVNYGIDQYNTEQLMREYCTEVVKYGDMPLSVNEKPRNVTVILNPIAKRRKCKKMFEKYCEPLLNLAGVAVNIIQTESENHARQLIVDLQSQTDAILVAGGDGTLSDVITGLMRKYHSDLSSVRQCPIGVLPLGSNNRIADSLFDNEEENKDDVQKIIDATLAVIRNTTKMVDVVEVEPLEKDEESDSKAVYAVGAVEWGAWKDANARTNKYWYWGPLKKYATYVFNGYKSDLNWDCNCTLKYSDPCTGCSQCFEKHHAVEKKETSRRWWHAFIPRTQKDPETIDYSKITNENCMKINEIPISVTELHLFTNNLKPNYLAPPSIKIELGPDMISYTNFIAEGWRREKGNRGLVNKTLEAKEIELHMDEDFEFKERSFYIDNEEFDLKPLKIKLLPKAVKMFSLDG